MYLCMALAEQFQVRNECEVSKTETCNDAEEEKFSHITIQHVASVRAIVVLLDGIFFFGSAKSEINVFGNIDAYSK